MSRVRIEESYDGLYAYVDDVHVATWDNEETHELFIATLMDAVKDGITDYTYVEVY
jgi:hypothetical protein